MQIQISIVETRLGGQQCATDSAALPAREGPPAEKLLIAIGATLATGMALLLFVFMRQALRNTAGNARSAEKLARIRQFLSLQ